MTRTNTIKKRAGEICTNLQERLDAERAELVEEIKRNKYFLSRKMGYDVGWPIAE